MPECLPVKHFSDFFIRLKESRIYEIHLPLASYPRIRLITLYQIFTDELTIDQKAVPYHYIFQLI